jgi:sugar/nucleoside kinase (ribokinase family)
MIPMEKRIVCVGILVADVVGRPVQSVPAPGRLVLVEEMGLYTGGCAVNSASALAMLGLPVEVIGRVGDDPFGEFMVSALQQRGVGAQGVKRDSETGTSATMVMVDSEGERRFVHYIGANARLTLDDIELETVRTAGILHVAGSLVLPGIDGEPTAWLLQEVRTAGVVTFLDTVWDDTGRWMKILAPCLPHLDYFIPSLPEAQAITGREEPVHVARALLDCGVGAVALKMGADGCLVATQGGEMFHLPAYQVEVVDATGAGDAFAAGFIAGVWYGWSLEKTAHLANAIGALCVTGMGALGGVRSLPETLHFMETTPLKNPKKIQVQ